MAGGGNIDIAIVAFLASGCSRRRRQMTAGEVRGWMAVALHERRSQANATLRKAFKKLKQFSHSVASSNEFTAATWKDVSVCAAVTRQWATAA